jgi:hypothetical protein
MNSQTMTLEQIREQGLAVLRQHLGIVGMVRFLPGSAPPSAPTGVPRSQAERAAAQLWLVWTCASGRRFDSVSRQA